jgi:hypothetical protein
MTTCPNCAKLERTLEAAHRMLSKQAAEWSQQATKLENKEREVEVLTGILDTWRRAYPGVTPTRLRKIKKSPPSHTQHPSVLSPSEGSVLSSESSHAPQTAATAPSSPRGTLGW